MDESPTLAGMHAAHPVMIELTKVETRIFELQREITRLRQVRYELQRDALGAFRAEMAIARKADRKNAMPRNRKAVK